MGRVEINRPGKRQRASSTEVSFFTLLLFLLFALTANHNRTRHWKDVDESAIRERLDRAHLRIPHLIHISRNDSTNVLIIPRVADVVVAVVDEVMSWSEPLVRSSWWVKMIVVPEPFGMSSILVAAVETLTRDDVEVVAVVAIDVLGVDIEASALCDEGEGFPSLSSV